MNKIISTSLVAIVGLFVLGVGYLTIIQKFDLFVLISFFINREGLQPFKTLGKAMAPNYIEGQFWMADKKIYSASGPNRGEVIVFNDVTQPDKIAFKRIIGLPGEEVEIREEKIYINGEILNEPYLPEDAPTYARDYPSEGQKLIVPQNNYYVLGDNRRYSHDSRFWGFLSREKIIGKITSCYKKCNL